MKAIGKLWRRMMLALRSSQFDRELDEEMRQHLEWRTQDAIDAGMDEAEARRAAARRLGDTLRVREASRDVWGLTWLRDLDQDLRFGVRLLWRNPGFAAAAILSLGLGIGATAGVFMLADAALLRELPVSHPGDLSILEWRAEQWPKVSVWSAYRDAESGLRVGGSFSFGTFQHLAVDAAPKASVAAFAGIPKVSLVAANQPWTAETLVVSGGYFNTVGARPALGRLLVPSDDVPGAAPAVVVSHRLWQRAFGGDAGAIGQMVTVNGQSFTVVGVAERSFFGLRPGTWVDLYLPVTVGLGVDPDIRRRRSPFTSPGLWWFELVARRRPGVTSADLEKVLDRTFGQAIDPSVLQGLSTRPHVHLRPGGRGYAFLVRDARKPLSVLLALAGLVLLVACANVGNLLLARSSARRQEWAMRLALGATRARVARQHLAEGAALGVFGGLTGLLVAGPFVRSLVLLFSAGRDDRWYDVGFDWRVLAFGAGLSVVAGLVLGVMPVIRLLTSASPAPAHGFRSSGGGWRRRQGLSRPLVAVQIALSLAMLVASGLFVRSLHNLHAVRLGFNAEGVLLFDVDPVRGGYGGARRLELLNGIRRTLEGVPGVLNSTRSSMALVDGRRAADIIRIPGRPVTNVEDSVSDLLEVGPDFHAVLQVPILTGRAIGERDDAGAPLIAVVNEAFARMYFPGEVPVGRQVLVDYPRDSPPVTIVGVARDAKFASIREDTADPLICLPDAQRPRATGTVIAVRVSGEPAAARGAIVRALGRAYPSLPLSRMRTFEEQSGEQLATERLLSVLSSAFGFVALVLAAVGLYGAMAFSVTRRTAEIGIRTALGATRREVVTLILRDAARVIVPGLVVGVGLALAAVRVIRAQLFGLSPTDLPTIVAMVCVVAGVAFFAAYVPARRAARVDPTEALRAE